MNNKKIKSILLLSTIMMSSFVVIASAFVVPVLAYDRSSHPTATVLLVTNNTIDKQNAVWVSLSIDPKIKVITYLNPLATGGNTTEDFNNINFGAIDVVVIDSYLPEGENLTYLRENINGTSHSTGLIFFGGNYTEASITQFAQLLPIEFVIPKITLNSSLYDFYQQQTGSTDIPISGYLNYVYGITRPYEIKTDEVQVAVSDDQSSLSESQKSMYVKRIAWQSCPLLYDRILTYNSKISKNAKTLVEVPNTKEPLVSTWDLPDNPETRVVYISPGTADIWKMKDDGSWELDEWNTPFYLWPYFNYLMYLMVFDTAQITGFGEDQIETYAQWPYSPIPHEKEAIIWMMFVASLWVFNFVLFFTLGKKKDKRNAENAPQPNIGSENKPTETTEVKSEKSEDKPKENT